VACSFGQFRAWFRGNPTKHDLVRSPNPTVTADTTEPAQTCPPMTPIYPGCQHGESSTIECTAMRASDQEYATERVHWVRLQFSCSLSPLPHAPPLFPLAPAACARAPCASVAHTDTHPRPCLSPCTMLFWLICVCTHMYMHARACAYKHKRTPIQKHPQAQAFACTRPSSCAHPCPCAFTYMYVHALVHLVCTSLPA